MYLYKYIFEGSTPSSAVHPIPLRVARYQKSNVIFAIKMLTLWLCWYQNSVVQIMALRYFQKYFWYK